MFTGVNALSENTLYCTGNIGTAEHDHLSLYPFCGSVLKIILTMTSFHWSAKYSINTSYHNFIIDCVKPMMYWCSQWNWYRIELKTSVYGRVVVRDLVEEVGICRTLLYSEHLSVSDLIVEWIFFLGEWEDCWLLLQGLSVYAWHWSQLQGLTNKSGKVRVVWYLEAGVQYVLSIIRSFIIEKCQCCVLASFENPWCNKFYSTTDKEY